MLFPALPPEARVWVFTADRTLAPPAQDRLLSAMRGFTERWTSHGRPVPGAATVLHDRFLVAAAHLAGGVSGCGIDRLARAAEEAGQAVNVAWLDGLHVVYRDGDGTVRAEPRAAFRAQTRAGAVTAETSVFVTTVDSLGDLRARGLERPAAETWHGRAFGIARPA